MENRVNHQYKNPNSPLSLPHHRYAGFEIILTY